LNVRLSVAVTRLRPNAVAVIVDAYVVAVDVVGVPMIVTLPLRLERDTPGGKLLDVYVTPANALTGQNEVKTGDPNSCTLSVNTIGDVSVNVDPELVAGDDELIQMRSFETCIGKMVVATYPLVVFDPTM